MGNKRASLFNVLTYVMLGATACLVVFYTLIGFNVFNPFPPLTLATVAELPTASPSPAGPTLPPVWTPTHTPTITPTPGPTHTRTPTLTPSVTPTFPPTRTPIPPTPRVTRSLWSFTYEVSMRSPQYGCGWTGVAGHVEDLDGNPLIGYPVHIWGAGIDVVVPSGSNTQHNTVYGSQAAWEQFFDSTPKPMEVRVQLHDPYRDDHLPISDIAVINFPGYCGAALGYVTFTQNH
ncbi:MAG: hypothetical protein DRI77_14470 [Chloroflexi bacterium]|nr:MAG: hypothetical protein DRI77_14470 [Chloroflexota bacterium]